MKFEYDKIKKLVRRILSIEELKGKVFLSGGIVPWLISDCDSGRMHGDIDFICKKECMTQIRQMLKDNKIYDEKLDSLKYPQEGEILDYGVDTYIDGIPVGFYPYEVEKKQIIQRSFSPELVDGKPDLKIKVFPDLDERDYLVCSKLQDGIVIWHSSLEIIKATKMRAGREKDIYDVAQIDRIGLDSKRAFRVASSIRKMTKDTLEERKESKKDAGEIDVL